MLKLSPPLKTDRWPNRRRWLPLFCLTALTLCGRGAMLNVSFNSIAAGTVVNLSQQGTLDWVHWGLFTETSIDRKAGVTPQISNFSLVDATNGFAYVYQYADNWNGYSWNDGAPHMTVTNTPTGVWAYGVPAKGSGFRIVAPAGTNLQTLKVYVGAFASEGRFTAVLSDNSAPGYANGVSEAVNNFNNGPSAVYSITYAAGSTGKALIVTYTLERVQGPNSASANVTLQAAALSAPGANNIPFVSLTSPADGASVAAPTNLDLAATASDNDGTVTLIEFYAGETKIGEAVPPANSLTWSNPPAGRHVLTARAIDNAAGVGISVPIAVFVATNGGSLAGARATAPTTLNLTTEGSSDWAHWGLFNATSFNHRASGASQISNFARIGTNTVQRFVNSRTAFTWADGTPVAAMANTNAGVFINGLTNGFQISAPADANMRTLRVYAGLYGAHGNFQAWLTDFSGAAFTDMTLSNVFGNSHVVYTVNYAASSPGQQLIVRYTVQNLFDFDYGNVTLAAATLQGSVPVSALPVVLFGPAYDSNGFRFSFDSAAGKPYAAQFTASLFPTNWQTFRNLSGNGGTLSVTDVVNSADQRFYRVLSE